MPFEAGSIGAGIEQVLEGLQGHYRKANPQSALLYERAKTVYTPKDRDLPAAQAKFALSISDVAREIQDTDVAALLFNDRTKFLDYTVLTFLPGPKTSVVGKLRAEKKEEYIEITYTQAASSKEPEKKFSFRIRTNDKFAMEYLVTREGGSLADHIQITNLVTFLAQRLGR